MVRSPGCVFLHAAPGKPHLGNRVERIFVLDLALLHENTRCPWHLFTWTLNPLPRFWRERLNIETIAQLEPDSSFAFKHKFGGFYLSTCYFSIIWEKQVGQAARQPTSQPARQQGSQAGRQPGSQPASRSIVQSTSGGRIQMLCNSQDDLSVSISQCWVEN